MITDITVGFLKFLDVMRFKKKILDDDVDKIVYNINKLLLDADFDPDIIKDVTNFMRTQIAHATVNSNAFKELITQSLYDALIRLFAHVPDCNISFEKNKTNLILTSGMHGNGKTSTVVKLGFLLKQKCNLQKVAAISFDNKRAAAQEQLEIGCKRVGMDFLNLTDVSIGDACNKLNNAISENKYDLIIVDTAGRSSDEEELNELFMIYQTFSPKYHFLVIDSTIGNISTKISAKFQNKVKVDGVIITKTDSHAKGGCVFNVMRQTSSPVIFSTYGEHFSNISYFDPNLFVRKILGMGNRSVLRKKQSIQFDSFGRIRAGNLNYNDLLTQLLSIVDIGNAKNTVSLLSKSANLKQNVQKIDFVKTKRQIAIIQSMRPIERCDIEVLLHDLKLDEQRRIKRIAKGSGSSIAEVKEIIQTLLKIRQYMMKNARK